jgi:hypothetical protein
MSESALLIQEMIESTEPGSGGARLGVASPCSSRGSTQEEEINPRSRTVVEGLHEAQGQGGAVREREEKRKSLHYNYCSGYVLGGTQCSVAST